MGRFALPDTPTPANARGLTTRNDQGVGNVASYRRNGYYILAQQQFGPSRLWAAYGSTTDGHCSFVGGAPCTSNGLGATERVAGYSYNINKYLDLYAVFYDIRNRTSGTYEIPSRRSTYL